MKRLLVLTLIFWSASAASGADLACEIEHLLGFIGSSGCVFLRNGESHDAQAARDHIERKYAYAKRWIETSEQFIDYTATKSSASGEPYRVICAGRDQPSADWLTGELTRLRAGSTCGGS